MGFSLSWLAVRGKSRAAVCEALDLKGAGELEEIPEAPFTGADLPKGWFMVVENNSEGLVEDSVLKQVSTDCEVVACSVEEHVMVSTATGWKNGQKLWSTTHDAQQGIEHLESTGEPPGFGMISAALQLKQQTAGGKKADVDHIFDIPVATAESLTGFRHDKLIPELGEKPFEVLNRTRSANSGSSLFKKLFGR
jgi:hypothetical protein